jgi:hypothetical protein
MVTPSEEKDDRSDCKNAKCQKKPEMTLITPNLAGEDRVSKVAIIRHVENFLNSKIEGIDELKRCYHIFS